MAKEKKGLISLPEKLGFMSFSTSTNIQTESAAAVIEILKNAINTTA